MAEAACGGWGDERCFVCWVARNTSGCIFISRSCPLNWCCRTPVCSQKIKRPQEVISNSVNTGEERASVSEVPRFSLLSACMAFDRALRNFAEVSQEVIALGGLWSRWLYVNQPPQVHPPCSCLLCIQGEKTDWRTSNGGYLYCCKGEIWLTKWHEMVVQEQ